MMLKFVSPILAIGICLIAIYPLRIRWWWKVALSSMITLISFKYTILYWIGKSSYMIPNVPGEIIRLAEWLFAVMLAWLIFLSPVFAGKVLIRLIFLIRKKKLPDNWREFGNQLNLFLLWCAVICASLGIFWGTCVPPVKEQTIFLKDLPPQAEGMKIAILTDIHIDTFTESRYIQEVVKRTNAAEPDLIVLLGDLVDGANHKCCENIDLLSGLKAKYGVYGVPGNHEYYSGYDFWMEYFGNAGITMLLNQSTLLPNGVYLCGITDNTAANTSRELPDPKGVARELPEQNCSILLAHRPSAAVNTKDYFDLQLSGHTHGGMIYGLDLILKYLNSGFVSGLYQVGDMQLYLSNGTFLWNRFPIRFGRFSEISLIQLKNPNTKTTEDKKEQK